MIGLLLGSAPLEAKKKSNFTTIAKPRTYKDAKPLPQAIRKPKKFSLLPDKGKKSAPTSRTPAQ